MHISPATTHYFPNLGGELSIHVYKKKIEREILFYVEGTEKRNGIF